MGRSALRICWGATTARLTRCSRLLAPLKHNPPPMYADWTRWCRDMAFARALGRPRRSGPAEGPGIGGSVSNPGPRAPSDERNGAFKAESASGGDAAARSGRAEAGKSGSGKGAKPGALRRPGSGGSARSAGARSTPDSEQGTGGEPDTQSPEGGAAAAAGGGQGVRCDGGAGRSQPRSDPPPNGQALAPDLLLQEVCQAPATSLAGPCCLHRGG